MKNTERSIEEVISTIWDCEYHYDSVISRLASGTSGVDHDDPRLARVRAELNDLHSKRDALVKLQNDRIERIECACEVLGYRINE